MRINYLNAITRKIISIIIYEKRPKTKSFLNLIDLISLIKFKYA